MNSPPSLLRRGTSISIVLFFLGVLAFSVDMPLNRVRPELSSYNLWNQLWTLPELFGDGVGVALICLTVFLFDPRQRPRMGNVALCAYLSGCAVMLAKPMVLRTRPRELHLDETLLATFQGSWLWNVVQGQWYLQGEHLSLPSGHAATAVGLAIGLSWLYPKRTVWFFLLAFAAAAQRILVGAHYLSDTLVGAAIAFMVCTWLSSQSQPGGRQMTSWKNGRFAPGGSRNLVPE